MTTMNTTSITTSRRIPRISLGPVWLLGWLMLAAWFGFGREWLKHNPAPAQAAGSPRPSAYTPQPKLEAVAISKMKVGDQVPADNPTGEKDNEFGDTVDPPSWRKLVLLATKKDGSFADVELLRPLEWLKSQSAAVGGTVDIDVPECGIEGQAEVLAIEPCPAIKHNARYRIVTGTFKHQASKVLEIYVDGLDEPIGTTPNHPFWSEDRQIFVRADELKEGEHLRAFNGTPIVRRIVPLADPEPVYNLEVQCDHVYHIAKNGLLVHNSGAWQCYENLVANLYGGRAAFNSRAFTGGATGLNRVADNVVEQSGKTVAVEAKRIGDWSTSIYNPGASVGQQPFAVAARTHNVNQLQDYADVFDEVHIHSNNHDFLNYMTNQANQLGLTNIFFHFTPH